MEFKILAFLLIFSGITWFISLVALMTTNAYRRHVLATTLGGAPLATNKLDDLYLPPLVKMQNFVFFFDTVVVLWYISQLEFWDRFKNMFPALQFDYDPRKAPEQLNVFLNCLLITLSKVSLCAK